jgi:hypothetical protein
VAERWLRPRQVTEAITLSSLTRVGEECWLVTGRSPDKKGFAALYWPLEWQIEPLEVPPCRAFLASAGNPARRIGLAVGTDGAVVWRDGAKASAENVGGAFDLSAAGVDAAGRGWAAAAGRIWLRSSRGRAKWTNVWEERDWTAPIVSLFAEVGVVMGVTADGGIVEGRIADLQLCDTASMPAFRARV